MKLYRVKDWEKHFETAKTKPYKNKSNYTLPLKFGLGYTRLLKQENGAALFGSFCAMICALSQHEPPRQGWLTENGKEDGVPLDAQALEDITKIPKLVFEKMLEATASKNIGWLDVYENKETQFPVKDLKVPDKDTAGDCQGIKSPLQPKPELKLKPEPEPDGVKDLNVPVEETSEKKIKSDMERIGLLCQKLIGLRPDFDPLEFVAQNVRYHKDAMIYVLEYFTQHLCEKTGDNGSQKYAIDNPYKYGRYVLKRESPNCHERDEQQRNEVNKKGLQQADAVLNFTKPIGATA